MKAKRAEILGWVILAALPLLLVAILFSTNHPSFTEVLDHVVVLSFVGYAVKLIYGRR